MTENEFLAERFEATRPHLRAVAYRMLGSLNEADDAVQEAWLRLSRADASEVDNLGGWLTTVVARVCLDMLRSRRSRREDRRRRALPEPIVSARTASIPSTRRCWPTRSGSRCSSCSRCSTRRSGSPSCCTTCSPCRSTRSGRSSGGRRWPRASSPAARGGGCAARPRLPTPTSPSSAAWSTRSSPPPATATSTGSSRCSTRMSCSAPTAASAARRTRSGARRPSPRGR